MSLDQKGTAMAEYIWIDSFGGVRSKSKVSCFSPDLPHPHHRDFC
jgi:glutamine synthetase